MFENLTYKKKNQLLAAGAIVLLFLIYTFAIKNTLVVIHDFSEASEKMELLENAPAMAVQLEKQLLQINSKIGIQNLNGIKTQQALLELISSYCQKNKAVLREFPESTSSVKGDLLIETNRFVLEGDFNTLVKLVYLLEQKNKLGKVASVRYQLKKDSKTKKMALTATIFLQNITNNSSL